jgi:ABC-type phosphate transport system ATPase subunit
MKLINYEFVTGKKVPRPWGLEYRFTAKDKDGNIYDEVLNINEKMTDVDIAAQIENALNNKINNNLSLAQDIVKEPVLTKETVEQYLKDNNYLDKTKTIDSLKAVTNGK